MTSLSARGIGLAGWVYFLAFHGLFVGLLAWLAEPGAEWPRFAWFTPLSCMLVVTLVFASGPHGWGSWMLAFALSSLATWLTTGPWLQCGSWRHPVLVLATPLLQWLALGIGRWVELWLPVLLLK